MIADHIVHDASMGRLSILAFLVGAHFQIMAKAERNRTELQEKIDRSVGKVWDAGGRAERRRAELEAGPRPLATVSDLAPRR